MAVRIRLTRFGRKHRPFFRIGVFDSRTRRDGPYIESLGYYDPLQKFPERKVVINQERLRYWLDHGALPTDSVRSLLKHVKIPSR